MKVSSVRGLVLGTPDLDQCRRFYGEIWGLKEVSGADEDPCAYFAGGGADHWILGLEQSNAPRLSRLRLAVDTLRDVDRLASQLVRDGLAPETAPAYLKGPGNYYGFTIRDCADRIVEISAMAAPCAGEIADPTGISHIVLNCADARACVNFYRHHFGFEISDWYEGDHLIFLRCNAAHHSIAFGQADRNTLNHVAYEMRDLESVIKNSERVKLELDQKPLWGPGRHGPGGNVFSYFRDPAGFVCEYSADLIQIRPEDNWVAKEWERGPNIANVWNTGAAPPEAIALMSGTSQS